MGPKARPQAILESPRRRRRLTVTQITALASTDEPYDVLDPDMPGLLLHIGAQHADGTPGAKSWQYRYRWRGKRPKLTLGIYPGTSQREAHERVRAARVLLDKGIDPMRASRGARIHMDEPAQPAASKAEPHSVAHLADVYLRRHIRPRLKRPEQVERLINVEVLKHWRTRDARTILPGEVIELLDAIVDRGAPSIANDLAAYLSQMFRFGIQQRIVETNPVQLLYKPGGTEKARDRALGDDELTALLGCIDAVMIRAPITPHVIRIALYTACRRSELCLAKWSDVKLDGDAPLWRVPRENSKTDVEYLIPLVPAAVAEFEQLKKRAGRSPYVLPAAREGAAIEPRLITRSIARHLDTLAEHDVEAFTLHDLRRTVRTGLARLKVQPHIAERVLNHKQSGVAAVYDVFAYADEKRAALELWADHLAALTAVKQ